MLEKITNFFRTFLETIFGGLRSLFLPKEREVVVITEPDPEDLVPQDGGDMPQDTIVTIDTNIEEIVAVPEEIEETPPPEISPIDNKPEPIPEPEVPEPTIPKQRFLWCLDNGHGKLTAGKRSPKLKDGNRFFEYEFNRIIVKGKMTSEIGTIDITM